MEIFLQRLGGWGKYMLQTCVHQQRLLYMYVHRMTLAGVPKEGFTFTVIIPHSCL